MVTHDVDEAVLLSDRIVMMTNGPSATIGEILQVELPRPRSRVALAEDIRYLGYRKAVIDFLYTAPGPRRKSGLTKPTGTRAAEGRGGRHKNSHREGFHVCCFACSRRRQNRRPPGRAGRSARAVEKRPGPPSASTARSSSRSRSSCCSTSVCWS
jgi:energy-coupling factor transporter ATP-binding protein EcfA2